MQFERAKEIYFNPNTVEVLYHGNPVWINAIDPHSGSAEVSSMLYDSYEREVPINELVEGRELPNNQQKQVLSGKL